MTDKVYIDIERDEFMRQIRSSEEAYYANSFFDIDKVKEMLARKRDERPVDKLIMISTPQRDPGSYFEMRIMKPRMLRENARVYWNVDTFTLLDKLDGGS